MSICPKPDKVEKFQVSPTPVSKTVNPPTPRANECGAVTKTITQSGGSGSTTTTIYIQGPPGPKGDKGDDGCSLGFEWKGDWIEGEVYVAQNCHLQKVLVIGNFLFRKHKAK